MKTNMLVFGLLYLLLGWMLPVCTRKISGTFITQDDQSFPLDMVESSVDDMYSTCSGKMEAKVKATLFEKEINKSVLFRKAWGDAEKCATKNMQERERGDEALTKDHMRAICVYTAGGPTNFYRTFNEAVRTNKSQYNSSFPYHSLHFWLTSAIQILNKKNCYTTFRRTKSKFTGNVNKVIRFGTFTSTSKLANQERFGKITCFKITACHGAYLKKYPKLKDEEQEVLIPPYEKFTIIKKGTFRKKLSDCEIVHVLKSNGVQSNLDCQYV